jgi:hypothetical protein
MLDKMSRTNGLGIATAPLRGRDPFSGHGPSPFWPHKKGRPEAPFKKSCQASFECSPDLESTAAKTHFYAPSVVEARNLVQSNENLPKATGKL